MLGQKEGIQLEITFDCVPRNTWNFASFHLTYSWPGHWTLRIITKVVWVQFCRRNSESTKPVVPKPVINQLRTLEQELTLQTHALDYFINETEIVS